MTIKNMYEATNVFDETGNPAELAALIRRVAKVSALPSRGIIIHLINKVSTGL